jgi:hypothetical protein
MKFKRKIYDSYIDKVWKSLPIPQWASPKYDGDWIWGGTMYDISMMVIL